MIKFDKIQMTGYYAAGLLFFPAWGTNACAGENAGDWCRCHRIQTDELFYY